VDKLFELVVCQLTQVHRKTLREGL
jgi:hypothetical protein